MQQRISFNSSGLKLSGVLHLPDDGKEGKRPAFLALHGFGSNKNSRAISVPAETLASWGYAVLRFDMRGCGESEGVRARLVCLEQVEDTKSALAYLASRPEIDGARIGCIGTSFGAAVAIYVAGVDERIAAVISSGGWGDGVTKFRAQHSSPEAWGRFVAMMEEGQRRRAKGDSLMVPRFDIVPIKPELRNNLAPGSIMEFHFDTVESMYNFRANDVVGRIAPRPLLLLHGSRDSVTPTQQSIDLFSHAGDPTDLHLIARVDHFMLAEGDPIVVNLIRNWLEKHFPPG
jgi:pimeloyl-ACP methyl ester carboxylesterase